MGDMSDIPVINDGRVDEDWTEEERQVMQALDDEDMPSEGQIALTRSNSHAWIAPKSDRTESGGIPIGQPPEKIAGSRIAMIDFDENGQRTEATFTITGMSDPVVKEVMAKYAAESTAVAGDRKAYCDLWEKIMREIADKKKALVSIKSASRPTREKRMETRKEQSSDEVPVQVIEDKAPSYVDAEFEVDLGTPGRPVTTTIMGRYADASIQGNLLILVAREADRAQGITVPPKSDQSYVVRLSGLEQPVRVFSAGLTHTDGGKRYFILFVDRPNE